MATKLKRLALAVGAITVALSSGAYADATPEMLSNTCAGCHGTLGHSSGPASPIIAGINAEVFVDTMERYKSGDIYSTIMGRIAKGYTTEDFEKMASFFNAQEFKPATQEYAADLVEKGAAIHDKACESCHAEGGMPLKDEDGEDAEEFFLLAGQWTPYLQFTIQDFREERREMPKKMRDKLEGVIKSDGEDGLTALFAFYASQQ